MENFKELPITGTAWERCSSIGFQNPHGAPSSYSFAEEKIMVLDTGKVVTEFSAALSGMYAPSKRIPVIDPETGVATGAFVSEAYLYQLLYSKYMQLIAERDATPQPLLE